MIRIPRDTARSYQQDLMEALNALVTTLNSLITQFKDQYIDSDKSYVSIAFPHHEVHEGNMYVAFITVAAGSSVSLSFKTPPDKIIHFLFGDYASESGAHVQLKEEVTITATTGTEITVFNHNRNSSNEPTVLQNKSGAFVADGKILKDATTTGGTVVAEDYEFTTKKEGAKIDNQQNIL